MRLVSAAVLAAFLCAAPMAASAADPRPKAATAAAAPGAKPTPEQAEHARIQAVLDSLKPQHGSVVIPGADAKLIMGDRYYFLDAADARKVLVDIWGNRADETNDVLGMFLPKDASPASAPWGAVVTWQGDGYVSDKDAQKTDYADLLKKMQAADADQNKERVKAGFEAMSVAGWAQTPAYDAAHHTLVWARDLKIGDKPEHGLNYDIRVLGRKGVLSLNIVAGMKDLKDVQAAAAGVRETAAFDPGARYQDYKEGTDKRAAYGVAGLVAAGVGLAVAKKAGLLMVLLLGLKKFGVVILAVFGGAGAWIARQWKRLFNRRDASDVGP